MIDKVHLLACVKLLTEFEDNGDIVEGVYKILDKLLQLCNDGSHQTVKEIEKQSILMKQAVMHSTSYQCQDSFNYLQTLIEKSDSFRGKEEMRQALEKFKPNQEEDD